MTPTQEQAQAAMEHISAELAVAMHVQSRSASIRVEHLATLLTLLDASARALGPFAKIGHEVNYTCPDERKLVDPWASSTAFDFREAARLYALIAPKPTCRIGAKNDRR